jgi:hypothetical protein
MARCRVERVQTHLLRIPVVKLNPPGRVPTAIQGVNNTIVKRAVRFLPEPLPVIPYRFPPVVVAVLVPRSKEEALHAVPVLHRHSIIINAHEQVGRALVEQRSLPSHATRCTNRRS